MQNTEPNRKPLPTRDWSYERHDLKALGMMFRPWYESGWTVRRLESHTGFSYGKVHRALMMAGTEFRKRGGATGPNTPVNPSLWDKLHQQSLSHQRIGRLLATGASLGTIELKRNFNRSTLRKHVMALQVTFGVSELDELRAVLRDALLKK